MEVLFYLVTPTVETCIEGLIVSFFKKMLRKIISLQKAFNIKLYIRIIFSPHTFIKFE